MMIFKLFLAETIVLLLISGFHVHQWKGDVIQYVVVIRITEEKRASSVARIKAEGDVMRLDGRRLSELVAEYVLSLEGYREQLKMMLKATPVGVDDSFKRRAARLTNLN